MLSMRASSGVVSLPTGAGKSIVIAKYSHLYDGNVLVLQPNKEILRQNRDKLITYVGKDNVGIYSASFNSKQIRKFTFATIQSVYKKGAQFSGFKRVVIDETHLYKNRGMFSQFFKNFSSDTKIFGLSATPYRIETKSKVFGDKMQHQSILRMLVPGFFKEMLYVVNTRDLVEQGYLSPIKFEDSVQIGANFGLPSDRKILNDFLLRLSLGGYKELASLGDYLGSKRSNIVFTPDVGSAVRLSAQLGGEYVDADTPAKERDRIINDFRSGKVKTVFNVNILTTGFDYPELDSIVLLRPTNSLILYNQMLGRGMRKAPGKTHCSVYDPTGMQFKYGSLQDISVERNNGKWDVRTKSGYMADEVIFETWTQRPKKGRANK